MTMDRLSIRIEPHDELELLGRSLAAASQWRPREPS